jgi:hypothetical protein
LLIKLHEAWGKDSREVWINPDYVQLIYQNLEDTEIHMDEEPLFVKESAVTIATWLSVKE